MWRGGGDLVWSRAAQWAQEAPSNIEFHSATSLAAGAAPWPHYTLAAQTMLPESRRSPVCKTNALPSPLCRGLPILPVCTAQAQGDFVLCVFSNLTSESPHTMSVCRARAYLKFSIDGKLQKCGYCQTLASATAWLTLNIAQHGIT